MPIVPELVGLKASGSGRGGQGNPQLLIKFRARQVYKRLCLQNRAGRKTRGTGRQFIFYSGDDGVFLSAASGCQVAGTTGTAATVLVFRVRIFSANNKNHKKPKTSCCLPIRELSFSKPSLFSPVSSLKNSSSSVVLSVTPPEEGKRLRKLVLFWPCSVSLPV